MSVLSPETLHLNSNMQTDKGKQSLSLLTCNQEFLMLMDSIQLFSYDKDYVNIFLLQLIESVKSVIFLIKLVNLCHNTEIKINSRKNTFKKVD